MPAGSLLKFLVRCRFRLVIVLLQTVAVSPGAAENRLAPGHVPAVVAHGNVAALGRVPATNQLRLALALPLRDPGGLTNLLAAIYAPGSPLYHHYLTPHEFASRFGATPADYDAVTRFAKTNGLTISATHSNRLLLDVSGRVADVERALHVQLNFFRHPTEARAFFAPDREPAVDARLPLLHVSGLDDFSRPHPNVLVRPAGSTGAVFPNGGTSRYGTYMGNDFRLAYVPGTALTGAGQNVGLLQFDAFYPEDITNYANVIGLSNNAPQVVVVPVDGGVGTPGSGSVEAALDIEMVMSMAPGVSTIYVYEAPQSPWVDILSQMANDDLAAQLSCSWSGGGPDPSSEQIFLQMAAQGQSFFNATGDGGAFTNLVEFPSASPNITEVGGTFLATDTNGNYGAEAVWNRGGGVGGSGGVAPLVGMPAWQVGVDMTTNNGSTIWRNTPDVALTAESVYVIADGQDGTAAGTSCAAPLWAGFMALVNQQAAQLGQPPAGFLNPAIYALCQGTNYALTFHDVTIGNNTNLIDGTNYYAVPGFDLCTGWGTPAGTNLINALTVPDCLGILPPLSFFMSGQWGGPFPQTNWMVTLTNSGADDLNWSLGGAPPWLTVAAGNGTLVANDSTNIILQLVNPGGLPVGSYRAVLQVTNLAWSRVHNVVLQVNVSRSLVQNGGFETGDFSGWTLVGDTSSGSSVENVVATDWDFPGLVHSGNYGAFLGQFGYAATLSQTLATVPGQQYLVSFWLNNPAFRSPETFSASWDGSDYVTLENPDAFTWSNFQFVVTAQATNCTLQFASEHDADYFGFDDVSVLAMPPLVFTDYSVCPGGLQLWWSSLAGLNYMVQYSTNLADGGWLDLCPVAAWTNFTTFADTNNPNDDPRFYRLLVVPSD